MGTTCSSSVVKFQNDNATNDVDRMLAEAEAAAANHFKILLLGAGESGKSTVVKQIQMIYQKGGIPDTEKQMYIENLRHNVVETMQTLIEARRTLELPLGDGALADAEERVLDVTTIDTPDGMDRDISALWADSGIQATYGRRSEFWHLDATPYYMAEQARIFDAGFEPTEEDMLMTRVRTTGIALTDFQQPPYTYQVVDVGGQRNERRKWIHCFDDVSAIIFLVGLSGYHQVLFEDGSTNRMHESLELFSDITKNPLFKDVPFIVYLNKKDLFEEMIPQTPLSVCFPEYSGGNDTQTACAFVEGKFRDVMETNCPGKGLQVHVIAARVRMDMKVALAETLDEVRGEHQGKKGKKRGWRG